MTTLSDWVVSRLLPAEPETEFQVTCLWGLASRQLHLRYEGNSASRNLHDFTALRLSGKRTPSEDLGTTKSFILTECDPDLRIVSGSYKRSKSSTKCA